MWDFILNRIPWWIQVGVLALIVGVPTYVVAAMLFGTRVVNRYVLHGVGAIAILGLASKLRQDGYKDRLREEDRANKVAEDVAEEERRKSKELPDVALNKEVDRWSKH